MRAWLARTVLFVWIMGYWLVAHPPVAAALIFYLGTMTATIVGFLALGIWSSIFYLLLCREGFLDRVRDHLARLKEKQERGILVRIRKRFSKHLSEGPLLSPLWILIIFIYPGPFWGVLMTRLAYPVGKRGRVLRLIWSGSAATAFFWMVVILGPLMPLLRGLIRILFGGG